MGDGQSGGPPEGLAWRPETSGNSVTWNGRHLVQYRRERAVLSFLASTSLPVPQPHRVGRPGELHMEFLSGMTGSEAIERNHAVELLRGMGAFLAHLHQTDRRGLTLPGDGSVVVHGDFAPHNTIFDPTARSLVAVIDWETAHFGNPLMDLAWCEHQLVAKWPRHTWALPALFEGYGRSSSADDRAKAVTIRLDELRSGAIRSEAIGKGAPSFVEWRAGNARETAAFLAALSRVLYSPT